MTHRRRCTTGGRGRIAATRQGGKWWEGIGRAPLAVLSSCAPPPDRLQGTERNGFQGRQAGLPSCGPSAPPLAGPPASESWRETCRGGPPPLPSRPRQPRHGAAGSASGPGLSPRGPAPAGGQPGGPRHGSCLGRRQRRRELPHCRSKPPSPCRTPSTRDPSCCTPVQPPPSPLPHATTQKAKGNGEKGAASATENSRTYQAHAATCSQHGPTSCARMRPLQVQTAEAPSISRQRGGAVHCMEGTPRRAAQSLV